MCVALSTFSELTLIPCPKSTVDEPGKKFVPTNPTEIVWDLEPDDGTIELSVGAGLLPTVNPF